MRSMFGLSRDAYIALLPVSPDVTGMNNHIENTLPTLVLRYCVLEKRTYDFN